MYLISGNIHIVDLIKKTMFYHLLNNTFLSKWGKLRCTGTNLILFIWLLQYAWLTSLSFSFISQKSLGVWRSAVDHSCFICGPAAGNSKTFFVQNSVLLLVYTPVFMTVSKYNISWIQKKKKNISEICQLTWLSRLTKGQTQIRVKCKVSAAKVSDHLPAGFICRPHRVNETASFVCCANVLLKYGIFLAIVQDTIV